MCVGSVDGPQAKWLSGCGEFSRLLTFTRKQISNTLSCFVVICQNTTLNPHSISGASLSPGERERERERERDPLAFLTHLNGFFTLEKHKAIVIVKETVKSIVCPRFSIYHYVLTLTLSQSSITYYIYFLLLDNMQGWFIVTMSFKVTFSICSHPKMLSRTVHMVIWWF